MHHHSLFPVKGRNRVIVKTVGYSGSREGMTEAQVRAVERLLFRWKPTLVVHGACTGGDEEFDKLCFFKRIHRRCYPANNVPGHLVMDYQEAGIEDVRRASKAPYRNLNIITDSDVMICCPRESKEPDNPRGAGTWYSIRHTRLEHKPLYLIWPNGFVQDERVQEVLYAPDRRRFLKE